MLKVLKKLVISIMLMLNISSCVVFAQYNSADQLTQTNVKPQIRCILAIDDERKE